VRFEEIPQQLIERAREGRFDALEELCLMVQPDAYAVLLSLLRNADDAEDALQETLIRVIRFLPKLRDVKSMPGWLMRLLVNQAAATRKSRSRVTADIQDIDDFAVSNNQASMAASPPSPRRAAETSEVHRLINSAIQGLPDRQKTALILYETEMLTVHQVAEAMDLTDGAIKFHLHEARKNLRSALQEMGIGDANLSQEVS
jgi:RNA polymerase sigma-70 factor (ECF subfamily)